MDPGRTATALATAAASALLLAGCTGDAEPAAAAAVAGTRPSSSSSSSAPSPMSSATYGLLGQQSAVRTCTEIGNAEGVSVDLSAALPQEDAGYFATVSVPSLGASSTTGFAGNDVDYRGGRMEADLTGAPVTVVVSVTDSSGRVVYSATGTASPTLWQPNGPECDGENYVLGLVGTPGERLVPRAWG